MLDLLSLITNTLLLVVVPDIVEGRGQLFLSRDISSTATSIEG